MRRNMGRRGNNNSGGNGPLMTGHLQDIDLELELLKRKREMIEQQQQLLVMEQQFQTSRHSYDQMRYDEPVQHGSNRDFAHLYETGPKHRQQFGRKRQAENQWQYDSGPKRTPQKKKNPPQFNQHGPGNSGSGSSRPQKPHQGFNQGSKFSPRAPAPLMEVKVPKQSIGQKIANQKAQSKTPRKDFAPSKVSKPKAASAPNKLASQPVAERKKLVAAATKSSDADVSRMLLPDRTPSLQVSGRLELALGAIMKNIRALITGQPQHASVLRSIQLQRVMKQAVRERIRTVMLGKVVGGLNEILAIYREEFPEETDADVLNIALEAGGIAAPDQNLTTKFIKSEDPGEFFKANMTSLLETKLNEMFSKLEEIYGNAPANDAPSEEQTDLEKDRESDLEKTKESDLEKTKESDLKKTNESDLEKTNESDLDKTNESDLEMTNESDLKKTNESDQEKTNKSDLEKNDESNVENKMDSDLENKKEGDLESNKEGDLENNELEKNKEGNLEIKKEIDVEKNKVTIDLQKNAPMDLVKNREEHNKNKEFTQEYKDFLNSTIKVYDVKRVIPKLIKRYIPYIVKLLNHNMAYQTTKAAITKKANEMSAKVYGTKGTEKGQGDAGANAAPTPQTPTDQRQMYNLPYYVKIMGRPTLPKRKVMQGFLTQFNPQSIKKHRTIHNLLFVGFTEKSDFDVMVGADGTVIGRSTLSVRICTKQGPQESNGENNANDANDVSQGEDKAEEGKDADIISPELDGQITDLLSAIRKSDEEELAKKGNGEVTESNNGEDKPQAENNPEEVMEEGEDDILNDEENADNEEDYGNEENIDETEENQGEEVSEAGEPKAQDTEAANKPEVPDDSNKDKNSQEANEGETQSSEKTPTKNEEQTDDKMGELKNATGRSTPSRISARLANVTPSSIRTRRASRLVSQN